MHKAIQTPLTSDTLSFFINQGYEFCLFDIQYDGNDKSSPVLTPLKERPHLRRLQNRELLFRTCEEPVKMVNDTNGPLIMMELDFDCLGAFIDFLKRNKSPMRIV